MKIRHRTRQRTYAISRGFSPFPIVGYEVQNIGYWLAISSQRYQVSIHYFEVRWGVVQMVVTAPQAQYRTFVRDFCSYVGRDIRRHSPDPGKVWSAPPRICRLSRKMLAAKARNAT